MNIKKLKNKCQNISESPTNISPVVDAVVTIAPVKKGEIFTKDNIWVKRPGTGEIKAEHFESLLNKKININISKNTQITWDMISD